VCKKKEFGITMKLNIANPATGAQKCIEFDDEKKSTHLLR